MSTTSPILLILGYGPRVGKSVAEAFIAKGYKVAVTSRKLKEEESTSDQLNISADLSDPESVADIFSKVKSKLGLPSVVVYNAAAAASTDSKNIFSVSLPDFTRDLHINTTSAFVAAQQAVLGFKELPDSASKTFIYTGNALNTMIIAPLFTAGAGKSATAHIIQCAADVYADRGYKFYYADERKADGAPAYGDIDAEAHGKYYLELAGGKKQEAWLQTFVKEVGYKNFGA